MCAEMERERENASAFKSAGKWVRHKLLLSVCSSFRIDFYQRQFLVIIAFCAMLLFTLFSPLPSSSSVSLHSLSISCLSLYRNGGLKDKLLGPYWNLLLNLLVAVIVFAFVCGHFIRYVICMIALVVVGLCSFDWLILRFEHSNELLPLKMQKHFTLFLMHA